jgi:predicted nucleic acid-binding protein
MYLLDTNVVSEARKGLNANPGVVAFRSQVLKNEDFLPVQVIGELRRGVENLRHRGDIPQAQLLEGWLEDVLDEYRDRILSFDAECAHIWGRLAAPSNQNLIDKQVAAIALLYDLVVVTRNVEHFAATGARVLNPFHRVSTSSRRPLSDEHVG